MTVPSSAQSQLQSIEELLQRIEKSNDPAVAATAKELVQLLLDFHGSAIERMLEIVHQNSTPGNSIIDTLGRDALVRNLLLLYGLHPDGVEARVQQALEKTRPYLKSHGGNVNLLEVDPAGVVRLRLEGNCHGCPSSSATLKLAVEEAIYEAAPDVVAIIVEGAVEEAGRTIAFVPVSQLNGNSDGNGHDSPFNTSRAAWEDVFGLDAIPAGTVRAEEVAGREMLFCKFDETLYAYDNNCPGCSQPLSTARLEGAVLVCPICSQHFDVVRAGRGLDLEDLHLAPIPLLRENGRVRVALPAVGVGRSER